MLECPIPISRYPEIRLAHGGGGRLMRRLIDDLFGAAFDGLGINTSLDAAVLEPGASKLAFTTDAFVVTPWRFPGGDIGKLAVFGTVNDLATAGARPKWMSVSFILEEGFAMEDLWEVALSIRAAAEESGIDIVTGDTKVVDRGSGDGVFITTTGIGIIDHDLKLGPSSLKSGDAVLVSGDVGRHGMAIMATREGLGFQSEIESDCAPLHEIVLDLIGEELGIRCIRDLTRGGLVAATNEIAESSGLGIALTETDIPVRENVRAACEILGLDPLYVANEGTMLVIVSSGDADRALDVMRRHERSRFGCKIGSVTGRGVAPVTIRSTIGVDRVLDLPVGEQLPRIC